MLTMLSYLTAGLLLIVLGLGAALVMALIAFARTGKGGSQIVVDRGAASKLLGIAMTGNVDALLAAAVDSFHLHLADGSLGEKLLKAGLAEVQRNVTDPNGKTPIVDTVAMLTGKTRQQVLDLFKAELDGPAAKPATLISTAAVTAALLLLFSLPAFGAETWGMPVKGPQRFYERDATPIVDPPLMRDARGQLVEYKPVSHSTISSASTNWPVEAPNGSPIHYQTAYAPQQVGWWNRGPTRRFVSAPFRWRPIRRLFGRC